MADGTCNRDAFEDLVREIWAAVLDIPAADIGLDENFFALGGDSLLLAQVVDCINVRLYADRVERAPHITEYFAHTTVRAVARRLSDVEQGVATGEVAARQPAGAHRRGIAIIGFAGRFPGATNTQLFWENLRRGVECIQTFSDTELRQAGVAADRLAQPGYVKRGAVLEQVDCMDADFFGLTPREAALTCPQQRLLLECAEEALELAGYGARDPCLRVGVFASAGHSAYVADYLYDGPGFFESLEGFGVAAINGSSATRMAYLLDLTGPSLSIDTACSSSLVDVHLACQSLLNGECDMALAGGATVSAFGPRGYFCEEGGVVSPDGHCRPFDDEARGTVFTSGAGVVLLKPLEKALEDRDTIHAVILGSAINNDGKRKVGYTAPGLAGQAAVLSQAYVNAGIDPSTVQYIEAHGTGTPLGDPIEVAALQAAFPQLGQRGERCALGALKGNVGHLQVAAGVAGLIKATLALHHREIPPSGCFRTLNGAIALSDTGFYVNERLQSWTTQGVPRRAGVSSFGIGGTNVHVVVEEAPSSVPVSAPVFQGALLLIASARSASALRTVCTDLAAHVAQNPDLPLANVAYTLQIGRAEHAFRSHCVCADRSQAVAALRALSESSAAMPATAARPPPVIFMFPGQGSQHPQMLQGLYADEPVFRDHVDRGSSLVLQQTGTDIRSLLRMGGAEPDCASVELAQRLGATELCQPMLFVLEYALAQLWLSWGIKPVAMIGHSLGEYVAACVAGVLPPAEMLRLLVQRGRIMGLAAPGSMLSVGIEREQARKLLEPHCSIAAVNGPRSSVISGPTPEIARIESALKASGVRSTRLPTSHAYHSPSMQSVASQFAAALGSVNLEAPGIPYVSNLTGRLILASEATSVDYWVAHLLGTVEFAAGIATLSQGGPKVFLEVGPGCTLANLARPMVGPRAHQVITSSRHALSEESDSEALLGAVGKLWQSGVQINWAGVNRHGRDGRVPLPTYPFERQRHWVELRQGRCVVAEVPSTVVQDDRAGVASMSKVETALAGLWSELLGVNAIGVRDDFFELGGDSLLAAQLGARSQTLLGRRISPAELFRHRTIAGLAELLATTGLR